MEDWAKPITSQILKPLKPSIYKIYKQSINNPANEFQKFILNSGGHCGGWLEHDHLLFLRERRKSKDKEKFLTAIKNFLPGGCISIRNLEKYSQEES